MSAEESQNALRLSRQDAFPVGQKIRVEHACGPRDDITQWGHQSNVMNFFRHADQLGSKIGNNNDDVS